MDVSAVRNHDIQIEPVLVNRCVRVHTGTYVASRNHTAANGFTGSDEDEIRSVAVGYAEVGLAGGLEIAFARKRERAAPQGTAVMDIIEAASGRPASLCCLSWSSVGSADHPFYPRHHV